MAVCCEHNSKKRLEGLCKDCSEIKPYMVFRDGPNGGYFWGPGFPIEAERGQRPYWMTSSKKDEDA